MKRLYLFLLLSGLVTSGTQAQSWVWAHQSTGGNTYSHSTATDPSGNVYVTGYYLGTTSFDAENLPASGGRDIYVAKYDGAGTLQWIRTAGCNKPNVLEQGTDIATDASGNVYVIGDFGANALNCFVAKYNTAGVIQWVKPIGSSTGGTATGFGIAVDANNDVVVTGTYSGSTMVDTVSISGCSNCANVFVAKFNPSGDALWAHSSNAASLAINFGRTIATDPQNNVIIAGQMMGANSFEGTTLSGFGSSDIYVVKYDASGSLIWARDAGSAAPGDDVKGLGTDGSGNIYLSGNYTDNSHFGSISLAGPASGTDIYVAKMDPSGSFVWTKSAEASSCILVSMNTDNSGNCYLSGLGVGGVFGGLNVPAGSFMVKYDNAGTGSAYTMLPSFANSFNMTIHPSGDIITTGIISGGSPVFGSTTLSGNGSTTNMYVARLNGMTTGTDDIKYSGGTSGIYPNPAANEVSIRGDFREGAKVLVSDMNGRLISSTTSNSASKSVELDLNTLQPGLYLLQIVDGNRKENHTLVVAR